MNPNEEQDALKQSLALNQIAKDLLRNSRRRELFLFIIVIVSILTNIAIASIFIHYESQFTTTTTETITVEQDTGDGVGNNIFQSGERAAYIQDYYEGESLDGEAEGDSNQD